MVYAMELLALADDLTGALEAGAQFAARGIPVIVTTRPQVYSCPERVLVIDTETRHLDATTAAALIRQLAAHARQLGISFVYMKTGSTLRGNIGPELAALMAVYPESQLIYAPAYPAMGRTVRGGRLYVNGVPVDETEFARDTLNPVKECHIPTLVGPYVSVWDGDSDEHVEQAAEAVLRMGGMHLAAGPAALAGQISARLPGGHPTISDWPRVRRCLVINGSRHEVSRAQVARAEAAGWPVLETTVVGLLPEIAPDAVVVFGGDTAFDLIRDLGEPPLVPLGEILPGVPVSRVEGFHLITKAGGFGSPDLLLTLRELLDRKG